MFGWWAASLIIFLSLAKRSREIQRRETRSSRWVELFFLTQSTISLLDCTKGPLALQPLLAAWTLLTTTPSISKYKMF
jgi:hypothetical protein